MVTFILPGYSPHNKAWAEDVAKNLKVSGQIRPVSWDHWDDPGKTLRPKEKATKIVRVSAKDNVNIIAKSVGTLVAAYVTLQSLGKVKKIILCGIPSTSDERIKIFKEAFSNFNISDIVCFQNERDPFKNPTEIRNFMKKVNPKIKVLAMPRSDHEYPYFEEFNKFLKA